MSELTDKLGWVARRVVKLESDLRCINKQDTDRLNAFEFYNMSAICNYFQNPGWLVTVAGRENLVKHKSSTLRGAIDAAIKAAKEKENE